MLREMADETGLRGVLHRPGVGEGLAGLSPVQRASFSVRQHRGARVSAFMAGSVSRLIEAVILGVRTVAEGW